MTGFEWELLRHTNHNQQSKSVKIQYLHMALSLSQHIQNGLTYCMT